MKYRIPKQGTTISDFADNKQKLMPTDPRFFWTCDRKHTYIFFGLIKIDTFNMDNIKGTKF